MAGENLFIAMTGFLITGVGLPLVAVLAIANAGGHSGLQTIARIIDPIFGNYFHNQYLYGDRSVFCNSADSYCVI